MELISEWAEFIVVLSLTIQLKIIINRGFKPFYPESYKSLNKVFYINLGISLTYLLNAIFQTILIIIK